MYSKVTVNAIDSLLGKEIKVLDKGFIRLIDYMGNDESIVQSARVSYGSGTKTVNQDEGLIRYLLRHRHTTPFEMCEIKLHIKAPIFIARQWLRHRTANVNEISARYSVLQEDYYLPDIEELCEQSKNNKQGRNNALETETATGIQGTMKNIFDNAFLKYNEFLSKHNLARELARTILPVGVYTEFYWKIDAHNLLHFLSLRSGAGAQKEIRAYSDIILNEIVKNWLPLTYKAFQDYRMNATTFYGNELEDLKKLISQEKLEQFLSERSGDKGEAKEFLDKLQKLLQK